MYHKKWNIGMKISKLKKIYFKWLKQNYFWNNQKELLGRVITVQYFEETTNKKDNSLSLRFPVYLELREPEKEVSYY